MAKLIYSALCSLDGYVADASGDFAWAAPDEEVLELVNALERPIGTYLYGRRMYETMLFWETADIDDPEMTPRTRDWAELWRPAEKIVYSRTLRQPASARTRIERSFDPAQVRALKDSAERDLTIGGAQLAGQALAAGLVDEVWLVLNPVVVGGGERALPEGVRLDLELREQRRFHGGAVYLHYGVRAAG
jgi:dihydrofolate reductase